MIIFVETLDKVIDGEFTTYSIDKSKTKSFKTGTKKSKIDKGITEFEKLKLIKTTNQKIIVHECNHDEDKPCKILFEV